MCLDYSHKSPLMDRLGIALSTLCLVHCLLLPVLLAVLPLVAISYVPEWLDESEWLHLALLVPVALLFVHGVHDIHGKCIYFLSSSTCLNSSRMKKKRKTMYHVRHVRLIAVVG